MKTWLNLRKLNKAATVIACVHWMISFFTDRLIFQYVTWDFSDLRNTLKSIETCGVKLIYLILLVIIWHGIFWFLQKADRKFVKIAAGYFLLLLLLLALTWPGIWRMDEFNILYKAIHLIPLFWQNYITSVFYMYAVMLFPFPSGVILVQCLLISLIVARLLCLCLSEAGRNAGKKAVLLLLPFVMLPVLDSNLYPMRMSLYAFLEVWLLAEVFFCSKRQDEERNARVLTGLSFLAGIVTVWRTEAVYYVLLYPLLLLLLGRGRKYQKQILLYLICTVILFVPQKVGERLESGQQYELTSIVLPLVPLVEKACEMEETQLLGEIDRVVNVDVILEESAKGKNGISMFWFVPAFQRSYDGEDFAAFKAAYYKLVLKYPGTFFKERLQTFVDSSDLLEDTTQLFTKTEVPNYETFKSYAGAKPLSNETRTNVIKMLEVRGDTYPEKLALTDIIYSAIPAIIILMIAAVILLCTRSWLPLLLILAMLVKVPLIILTAPSRLFMYYYSVYLMGYCLLFYTAFRWLMTAADRRRV